MIDTEDNIKKTIEELNEFFSKIDTSGKEYENIDWSYIDDDEDVTCEKI